MKNSNGKKIFRNVLLAATAIILAFSIVLLFGMAVLERNFAAELFAKEGVPVNPEKHVADAPLPSPIDSDFGYRQLRQEERELYDWIQSNVYLIDANAGVDSMYPMEEIVLRGEHFDESTLKKVVSVFLNENPECFWIADTFSFSYRDDDTVLILNSYVSSEELSQMRTKLNDKVRNITLNAQNIQNELDREIYIFDIITKNCEYNEASDWTAYTSYGAIINGNAVCEGYSRAFQLLSSKAGLVCYIVNGVNQNIPHMWNIIKIDSKFYHIDVTACDSNELTDYVYFNLSDEKMSITHTVNLPYEENASAMGNLLLPECNNMEANYYRTKAFRINSIQKKHNAKLEEYLENAIMNNEESVSLYIGDNLDFDDAVSKLFDEKPYLYINALSKAEEETKIEDSSTTLKFITDKNTRGITIKIEKS